MGTDIKRRQHSWIAAQCLCALLGACSQRVAPQTPGPVQATPQRAAALQRDDAAMDEALRTLLDQFRDKFRCNGVSGCPSQQALRQFGWPARPYVEQVFHSAPAQATYRSRAMWLVASLRDPAAKGTLRQGLRDRDPDVRGYAAWGLALLSEPDYRQLVAHLLEEPLHAWTAPGRLSALWGLGLLGDAAARATFVREAATLSTHPMAGPALVWAAQLCSPANAPDDTPAVPLAAAATATDDCAGLLAKISRNPSFLPRRAALRAIAANPKRVHLPVLMAALSDPVHSLRELAAQTLGHLAQDGVVRTPAQWRHWVAAQP